MSDSAVLYSWLGAWLATAVAIAWQPSGRTIVKSVGGGFITSIVVVLLLFSFRPGQGQGQGQNLAAPQNPGPVADSPVVSRVSRPANNFEVQEGLEYGYSAALSANDRTNGKIAPRMIMFKYAGQRNGKHQVHSRDGTTFTAMECANPCEVIKVLTFLDNDYFKDKVHVERYRNQPGSLANVVFDDALNGRLRTYGMERSNRNYQVWVDEQAGYQEHLIQPNKVK